MIYFCFLATANIDFSYTKFCRHLFKSFIIWNILVIILYRSNCSLCLICWVGGFQFNSKEPTARRAYDNGRRWPSSLPSFMAVDDGIGLEAACSQVMLLWRQNKNGQNVRMSPYANAQICECPNMPMATYVKMPKCQKAKMPKCQKAEMPKCQNI